MNTLDRTVGELVRYIPGATVVVHAYNQDYIHLENSMLFNRIDNQPVDSNN